MPDQAARLYELDELLTRLRLAIQRTGYRRRLLMGMDVPGGVSTLRSLRAVELLSARSAPSIRDVATRLAVEHSTASRSVDTAVRAGLLTKRSCQEDLRRTRLELTRAGRSILEQTSERRREVLAEVTRSWRPEDMEMLIQLLDEFCGGLDYLEKST